MTGYQLVTRVMRIIGSLATGETPSATDAEAVLTIVNDMLDTWAADRLMVFTITRKLFTPATNKQTYSYGPGGDFNDYRPPKIDRVSVITNVASAQPLELPITYFTDAQWQDVPTKNVQSTFPLSVYDDQNYPLRNLSYWPIPTAAWQPVFYVWTQLNKFPNLQADLEFPPAYAEAIKYNAAVRAVPEFGIGPLDPTVVSLALSTMATAKGINIPIVDLRCDDAVVNPKAQVYNWKSDSFVSH